MLAPLRQVDRVRLVCHRQAPCPLVRSIEVALGLEAAGLRLGYRLCGDLGRLRIPAPRTPAPADRLWAHTCFEAFVAASTGNGYREWNFSPSGQWAEYAFRGYRERLPGVEASGTASPIRLRQAADILELEARIPIPPTSGGALAIGLCAVVEDADGGLSYWALRHPAAQPDFHDRAGFALMLDPAAGLFSI